MAALGHALAGRELRTSVAGLFCCFPTALVGDGEADIGAVAVAGGCGRIRLVTTGDGFLTG